MDDLKAATEEVRDSVRKPLGKLRIGAPVWYMLRVMQPAIMRFMAAYPDVELDLVLDEGNHDLVNSGLDALVHFGSLPDTDLHALRVHSVQAILIASPEYLAEAGTPVTPPDLAGHRCLHHSYAPGNDSWSFSHQGQIIRQKIRPVLTVNNAEVLRMAALDGQGITLALWLFVEEDIKAGRLVQVLEDFTFPDLDVNIVHAGRRQATGALRAFLEFMAAQHVDCERQSP